MAKAFGYPLHRLVEGTRRVNKNGLFIHDLTAACGHQESAVGSSSPAKDFRSGRRGEFCENGCWD
jgi:hypothetical protein